MSGSAATSDRLSAGASPAVVHREPPALWHDVRQALMTISALAAAAESEAERADVRRRLILIREEVRRVQAITDALVNTRSYDGQELVPLHELAGPLLQARAEARGVRLRLDLQPGWVRGDRLELLRVVSNLADNACRAASDGGSVAGAVRAEAGLVVLEVGDSGVGFSGRIPGRPQPRGLAIVRSIIETHGGTLTFGRSEAGGALVRATFPAAYATPDGAPSEPADSPAGAHSSFHGERGGGRS